MDTDTIKTAQPAGARAGDGKTLALSDEQIDAIVDRHYRHKNHPDSYSALRATIKDALAAAPAVSAPAAFDAAGFRAWVLANLPDETVIGSSAWWADHLTAWAGLFVKGAIPSPVTAPEGSSK